MLIKRQTRECNARKERKCVGCLVVKEAHSFVFDASVQLQHKQRLIWRVKNRTGLGGEAET